MRICICDLCGKRIKEEDGKILGRLSISALRTDGEQGYTKSKCYEMCSNCSEWLNDILKNKTKEVFGNA